MLARFAVLFRAACSTLVGGYMHFYRYVYEKCGCSTCSNKSTLQCTQHVSLMQSRPSLPERRSAHIASQEVPTGGSPAEECMGIHARLQFRRYKTLRTLRTCVMNKQRPIARQCCSGLPASATCLKHDSNLDITRISRILSTTRVTFSSVFLQSIKPQHTASSTQKHKIGVCNL